MSNQELVERDLRVPWHVCTQMKDTETMSPVPIARGEGVWLEDFDGNRNRSIIWRKWPASALIGLSRLEPNTLLACT